MSTNSLLVLISVLAATAAMWSAVSSHRSASHARTTRRPYIGVTGIEVAWSGSKAKVGFLITNAGAEPGRITSQRTLITCPDGRETPVGMGVTEVNLVYPTEAVPLKSTLGEVEPGDRVDLALIYEDLPSKRSFTFDVSYLVHPPDRDPEILSRNGT
jgi:hypothetical protein